MKLFKLSVLVFIAALAFTGCGKGKKQVGQETRRDNELLQQAAKDLENNKHIVGRLLLNTLITTYPDSPYVPMAKLMTADSFYREGTSEALAQASVEYKDFANFFPTHPLADDALMQVSYIDMRQMLAPNRDVTAAKKAEKDLLAILQRYPNTNLKEEIQERLKQVRNHLAEHHMEVARVQMRREQLKGARNRLREVADEYPEYVKMDETLYRLGNVLFELEEPDEAAKYLARLVRSYPTSDYRERAAAMIETMGKAVPEAGPTEVAIALPQQDRGMIGSTLGFVMDLIANPNMRVPKQGILLKEDLTAEELVAAAEQYTRPSTVTTAESSVVGVGPKASGPKGGARGEQTVTVGGADQKKPDQQKNDEKKEQPKPN
jgi:outer membrane protein assembly factor BamD